MPRIVILQIMLHFLISNSHYSVNACLLPLCSIHGMAVTTVEGIGSLRTLLHPVQVTI